MPSIFTWSSSKKKEEVNHPPIEFRYHDIFKPKFIGNSIKKIDVAELTKLLKYTTKKSGLMPQPVRQQLLGLRLNRTVNFEEHDEVKQFLDQWKSQKEGEKLLKKLHSSYKDSRIFPPLPIPSCSTSESKSINLVIRNEKLSLMNRANSFGSIPSLIIHIEPIKTSPRQCAVIPILPSQTDPNIEIETLLSVLEQFYNLRTTNMSVEDVIDQVIG